MGKDYYKILGVEKNASQDEVKRAFRKLAHQYHPDKQGGDEAKFKEINEAYQVLGKPEKRQQYDRYGATFDQQGGFGGNMNWNDFMRYARQGGSGAQNVNFDFGDIGDIFGDLFGFGSNRRSAGRQGGRDIQVDLSIEFKEAAFGAKKQIELYQQVKCSACHGNGAEPGTPIKSCQTCGGQGVVTRVQQTILGAMQSRATCPDCRGQGKFAETKCRKCNGLGLTKEKVKVEFQIPAGIEDGQTIRLDGQGEAGESGAPTGDLYLTVQVKKDPDFERRGADIFSQINITYSQAVLGDKVEVKTIDGSGKLSIPSGTQSHTVFKLRGKGAEKLHGYGRGDHLVEVIITIPKRLNRQQKKLIQQLKDQSL